MSDGAPPPRQTPDRRWRPSATAAPGGAKIDPSRRKKLIFLTAILLALSGAVLGLLLHFEVFRRIRGASGASLPIREYSYRLYPANPYAEQDGRAILPCLTYKTELQFPSQTLQQMEEAFRKLGKHTDGPLVVHFTCLALAQNGAVWVLPGDARPEQRDSWLPLSHVLKELSKSKAPGLMLLLDLAHPVADSRLGILTDHVSDLLQQTLKEHAGPDLLVLCSAGPGETSHFAEELGGSVFAYHVVKGLKGAADGWGPHGEENRQVTATELAAYVSAATRSWVQKHRGQVQTPWLWPKSDIADFGIVSFSEPAAEGELSKPAYPEGLREAWVFRDQVDKRRVAPQLVLTLDLELLRIEQHWRRGLETDRVETAVRETTARFKAAGQLPAWDASPSSLAQVETLLGWPPASNDLVASVYAKLDQVRLIANTHGDDKKQEQAKEIAKEVDSLVKEFKEQNAKDKEPKPLDPKKVYFQAAEALVQHLAEKRDLLPAQVTFGRDVLEKLTPKTASAQYAEIEWLKKAAELGRSIQGKKNKERWKWPGIAVHQGLRTIQAREAVVALLLKDPALLGWLPNGFREAEEKRREGEKLLFGDEPEQWDEVKEPLQQAERQFDAVRETLQRVQACRIALADAAVVLPGFYPYMNAPSVSGLEEEAALWRKALEEAKNVGDKLAGTAVVSAALEDLLKQLRDTMDARARKLMQPKSGRDVQEIDSLLNCALLGGKDRANLWLAGQNYSRQLTDESVASKAAPASPAGGQTPQRSQEGLRRAQLSLELFKWSDAAEAVEFDAALRDFEAAKDKTRPDDLEGLATALYKAWAQLAEHHANPNLPKEYADKVSRLAPLMITNPSAPQRVAAAEIAEEQLGEVRKWLAKQKDR